MMDILWIVVQFCFGLVCVFASALTVVLAVLNNRVSKDDERVQKGRVK